MSTFYLLPPRPYLGQCFARYLEGLFPGLTWEGPARDNLADGLAAAATARPEVYVVFREELTEGEDVAAALADGFGAEPGDEVVEVRPADRPGSWAARRWHVPGRAAA